MAKLSITSNLIDIFAREIYPATITIENGKIAAIEKSPDSKPADYIMPGFVDSHVHIESSMLVPSEFARLAVCHGTVATVSDPHEIGNVLGIDGINFMIENGKTVPFKFNFGASSCVPATNFEHSGAKIELDELRKLLENTEIRYMSEMMNFPGIIYDVPEVCAKVRLAHEFNKPVDGHAPGLRGEQLRKYCAAGITTDHETLSIEEALEKISYGMKILIREGTAAKNYEQLHSLIATNPDMCMFCTDDFHPQDLAKGHINKIAARAVAEGYDLFTVLKIAVHNPVNHYRLDVGMLRVGDPADFIIIDNPNNFNVLKTYINGELAAENGNCKFEKSSITPVNKFQCEPKAPADFMIKAQGDNIRVIETIDGSLITNEFITSAKIENGYALPDTDRDILYLTVINRYQNSAPALGFIKNMGLKRGAMAMSVAHDSHNIIACGVSAESLATAVNTLIETKGGLVVFDGEKTESLPLPVAGLMTDEDGYIAAGKYLRLERLARELGSGLGSPIMTLSFMALLVIPSLKLSDEGLFDGRTFTFTNLFAD